MWNVFPVPVELLGSIRHLEHVTQKMLEDDFAMDVENEIPEIYDGDRSKKAVSPLTNTR